MKTLEINYKLEKVNIYLENGLLDHVKEYLDPILKYFIITDKNVSKLYLDKLTKNLNNFYVYILTPGELSKNITQSINIINSMIDANISKKDYIIAFGGGVVGDIAGFIASIFKRGINYINIPTTLLSQVDSSIGGKNGIDFNKYKNQIGTIYHPKMVFVDPLLLNSLPKCEFLSGMGEVIKYGLCFNEDLFNSLYSDFDLENVIYECIKIKAHITSIDEFEKDLRISLNFGHTIGHAIESLSNFKIQHGIAVSIGMLYEVKNELIKDKLQKLYERLGMIPNFSFEVKELIDFIRKDKKVTNEEIYIPKLIKVGEVEIVKMKIKEFLRGIL